MGKLRQGEVTGRFLSSSRGVRAGAGWRVPGRVGSSSSSRGLELAGRLSGLNGKSFWPLLKKWLVRNR